MNKPIWSDVLNLSNSDRDGLKGKKIAIVANCSWNIYNFRLNLIVALIDSGAEVLVITPFDEYTPKLTSITSIKVIQLQCLRRSSKNPIGEVQLLLELVRIYKEFQPDCVLHYTIKPNIYGALAARYLNIPSIGVVTGLGYTFLHNGLLNRLVKLMYKIAFQYSNRVIFENRDDRALFVNKNLVNVSKAYQVNGCGVNLDYFSPPEQIPDVNPIRFSFIGRLLYDKGIMEFINAANQIHKAHPDIRFSIVGIYDEDNPSHLGRKEIDKLISNGVIQFYKKSADVRPHISDSSCIVLPSYREGMPKILMEAMAMAKPIITTDTAGCRDLVESGLNGYRIEPKNVQELVDAMAVFIQSSQESRLLMGKYGRMKAETELSDKLIAREIIAHINAVALVNPSHA